MMLHFFFFCFFYCIYKSVLPHHFYSHHSEWDSNWHLGMEVDALTRTLKTTASVSVAGTLEVWVSLLTQLLLAASVTSAFLLWSTFLNSVVRVSGLVLPLCLMDTSEDINHLQINTFSRVDGLSSEFYGLFAKQCTVM